MTEKDIDVSMKDMASGKFVLSSTIKLIKHQPIWFALTTLSSYIFFFTPLVLALVTREIFDILDNVPRFEYDIWTLVWIIPIMIIIQMITEVSFLLFVFRFNLRNQILIRKNMIKGVFKQPGADALEKSPSEAISRFRGDNESIVWFTSLIGDITAFMTFAVIAFILMYDINPSVTLITFFPFIIVITVINLSRRKIVKYNDASRSAAGRVTGAVGESFGAIQAIKVASAEKNVFEHFRGLNDERRKAAVKDTALQAALRSFGQIIVSISTGIILLLVGQLMQAKEFTIGDFTLFMFLLGWLTGFIRFLGEFLAWFQRNKVSYGRVLKIMQGNSKSPHENELLEISPLYLHEDYPSIAALKRKEPLDKLEVRNLNYTYRETEKGIFDIDLSIPRGSLTVIVGRVGSGKSTLIKSILGLLPAKGEVLWNGKVVDPDTFMIPPKIAYTSQVPVLFSETIEENILLGLPSDSIDIKTATKFAVVDGEIQGFEGGFQTKVGPKGVRLSGGQKHRLAAARMFARNPDILVFDDLSSALDVATEEKLWEGLFKNPNSTYLVTSHRKYVLNRADNIIVMKDGKIIDSGKIKVLLERCEEMQALWEGKYTPSVPTIKEVVDFHYNEGTVQMKEILEVSRPYPTYILDRFREQITFKGTPVSIKLMFKNLVDIAFDDYTITEEEEQILFQIISDLSIYSAMLERSIVDELIDEKELKELYQLRDEIYKGAAKIANHGKEISSDALKLLERLEVLIQELQTHEKRFDRNIN